MFQESLDANMAGIIGPMEFIFYGFALLAVVFELYKFVNDETSLKELLLQSMGWTTVVFVMCVVITVVLAFIASLITEIIMYIPVMYPICIGSFLVAVYSLRYIRRLHKAIFGHIKNDKAHTPKELDESYLRGIIEEEQRWKQRTSHLL